MIMVYGVFFPSMVTFVTPDLLADHLFTIDFSDLLLYAVSLLICILFLQGKAKVTLQLS